MTSTPPKSAYEGVLAINKPLGISSAQVIRDVQEHFNPSTLFKPWFEQEEATRARENHNQRQKRRSWKQRQPLKLKIGHGGTLDPMATGVLIMGIGSGTKGLQKFLECTKSYEAVVLFGAATDTYDAVGKVVGKKGYEHVTGRLVEEALTKFRGSIMQRPPIFSALKVQGKPLYQYAREGKEVPIEIEERPVEVQSLEMTEWMEGCTHEYHWPSEVAPAEEKEVVEKVLHLGSDGGSKRKRNNEVADVEAEIDSQPTRKRTKSSPPPALASDDNGDMETNGTSAPAASNQEPYPAPACRLRMTVTSGFYVRSLAHDLGAAVGSLALMSSLVRTRQGEFKLGENVLEYNDLAKGEDVWGPKVGEMLADWNAGGGVDVGNSGEQVKKVVPRQGGAKPKAKAKFKREEENEYGKEKRRNSSSDGGGDG